MGRRRRFTHQPTSDDDDEEDRAAPQPLRTTKPTAPPSSGAKKQQRHHADEDDLELQEEEEDEKDLEEMRMNEEEERREETQTRRRRGRKPKRPAEESDEEPEEKNPESEEEEESREEDSTEAVPVGEPLKVTGKGKKQRRHYFSFEYEGNTFELEDPVLLTPEQQKEKPYVAIIKDITENDGSLSVTGQWFYRPEEADKKGGGNWTASDTRELFYSFHIDDVPAESVMHKCVVHFIPLNKQIPSRKEHPGFIVQKVYDTVAKKLWNLTDKDYEDNKQHEIDLLVKKTVDRIGQLPDREPIDVPADNTDQFSNKRGLRKRPPNPLDVSRDTTGKPEQFIKAETPGSDNLKHYAILAKYKAVTNATYRDKWLDKLVDTIPLTSKEGDEASHADAGSVANISNSSSSARDTSSGDNENSYAPDVVVSIMASLERSTYDALHADFQKYNQKMRKLEFNIKNSPVLRRRLMNKELDPAVLLTMSPDELKAGLTPAEKTSEPEEARRLQMTDARCERCTEKRVGISDIIHAGHGDRYQLECISCGYTWFSPRPERGHRERERERERKSSAAAMASGGFMAKKELGETHDVLRFGVNDSVRGDLAPAHPVQAAIHKESKFWDDKKKFGTEAIYGSAFNIRKDLDAQILSRFQRPPGALPSSMLGYEAMTGSLDDFGFEDYLNLPQDSDSLRVPDMHHGMEVRLGLSKGPICPSFN